MRKTTEEEPLESTEEEENWDDEEDMLDIVGDEIMDTPDPIVLPKGTEALLRVKSATYKLNKDEDKRSLSIFFDVVEHRATGEEYTEEIAGVFLFLSLSPIRDEDGNTIGFIARQQRDHFKALGVLPSQFKADSAGRTKDEWREGFECHLLDGLERWNILGWSEYEGRISNQVGTWIMPK